MNEQALTEEQLDKLQLETTLTQEEIQILFSRFITLDKDNSGGLDEAEIENLTDFTLTPLRRHLLAVLDTNDDKTIDFDEFLAAFSAFSSNGNQQERVSFLFKVYDTNNDGFICKDDLYYALKLMVQDNLTEHQLQHVVGKSIVLLDKDGDGKISFPEFSSFLEGVELDLQGNSFSIGIPTE
ncbi:hypothetical protein P9112_012579 [Eukaryota sp. TZLM1-RC]